MWKPESGTAPSNEAAFQAWVVGKARQHGWMIFHAIRTPNSRGRWGTHQIGNPGFPDLVLARRGVVIFWELKIDGKDASPEQAEWLTHLESEYTLVGIKRPSDWALIENVLACEY